MKADERAPVEAIVQELLRDDLVYKHGPEKGEHPAAFMQRVYKTALEIVRAEREIARKIKEIEWWQ